jgi:hypothetical protein
MNGKGLFFYPILALMLFSVTVSMVSPPSYVVTAENSNMNYGCMSRSGTTKMSQSYGRTHCQSDR